MLLENSSWMDIERYLQNDDRIILITGATEQHAYLSLLTDVRIPQHMAEIAGYQEQVLVAPPLNFGISPMFTTFPGTISLNQDTFNGVLTEVVQSLLGQGFAGFFILNGHSGNHLPPQLDDIRMDGHARIVWYDWWRSAAVRSFEAEHNLRLDHANWGENFPFTRLGPVPADEKPMVNLGYVETGQSIRAVLGDGNFGGPYQIDDNRMNELLTRCVNDIAEHLRALKR
ncbi:MAG: creatininase [Anaerolineaceae bacterium]|nr:creatininase [Anaerolineaceae bacterium]